MAYITRRSFARAFVLGGLGLLGTWSQSTAADNAAAPAANLSEGKSLQLNGLDGNPHKPLEAGDKKAIVLVFVSPFCPTSNTFMPEINSIAAAYEGKVAFYLVHSDPEVKMPEALQHASVFEVKTTVLLDKDQALAKLAQAKVTPDSFVISPDGVVQYHGRINDLYAGATKKKRQATTKDLRDALDAVLAGKAPATPRTEAFGCKISVKS